MSVTPFSFLSGGPAGRRARHNCVHCQQNVDREPRGPCLKLTTCSWTEVLLPPLCQPAPDTDTMTTDKYVVVWRNRSARKVGELRKWASIMGPRSRCYFCGTGAVLCLFASEHSGAGSASCEEGAGRVAGVGARLGRALIAQCLPRTSLSPLPPPPPHLRQSTKGALLAS